MTGQLEGGRPLEQAHRLSGGKTKSEYPRPPL